MKARGDSAGLLEMLQRSGTSLNGCGSVSAQDEAVSGDVGRDERLFAGPAPFIRFQSSLPLCNLMNTRYERYSRPTTLSNAWAITPYPSAFAWMFGPTGGGAQFQVQAQSSATFWGTWTPFQVTMVVEL